MFTIGSRRINGPFVLAPLAGYSDLPFRLLCREFGAALCVSEMISCHGLVYQQKNTLAMLQTCAQDRPVSFQLFGADAAVMGEAAAIMDSLRPDIIDINMGCPVKKVTKRGAGAALMTDLRLAEAIVTAVVRNCSCPVSVKIRSGPDSSAINAVTFARMIETSGAAAVTVHGRTWKQAFSGVADWDIVRDVKTSVSIPVIGNGDINSASQGFDRMTESGCDAVMIGRAALGNPWVFDATGRPADLGAILTGVERHIELLETFSASPQHQLGALKNHLGRYFRGFSGSSNLRRRLYETHDWNELKRFLKDLVNARPPFSDFTMPTDIV